MAIVHFTFKKEEVPAGAVNVQEGKEQTTQYFGEKTGHEKYEDKENWRPTQVPIWTYETHNGLCIAEREYNGHDDSDFYMTVWNVEKGEPEEHMFATTRGWSYPSMSSYVDATPEILALHDAYIRKCHKEAAIAQDIKRSKEPAFGKEVLVVRGRKVPQGTKGEIFWIGADQFSRYGGKRVGLRLLDGSKVFTAATNVEVINPDQYRTVSNG